jgi:hypothetical protein
VNDSDLRKEAEVFGRYLVGERPSAALVERYRAAPWSVSLLDAAAGLTDGGSLLRKKLLVMTAIVETTPELVTKTEPRAVGLPTIALRVGVAGVRTVFEVAAGLALSAMVKRRG